jgi:hypothetical protein
MSVPIFRLRIAVVPAKRQMIATMWKRTTKTEGNGRNRNTEDITHVMHASSRRRTHRIPQRTGSSGLEYHGVNLGNDLGVDVGRIA